MFQASRTIKISFSSYGGRLFVFLPTSRQSQSKLVFIHWSQHPPDLKTLLSFVCSSHSTSASHSHRTRSLTASAPIFSDEVEALLLDYHGKLFWDGQSLPNTEIVAEPMRKCTAMISVTQKCTHIFQLPQTRYQKTLAERNAKIANTTNLLVLYFFNFCVLAENQL
jgi:hypothetical protein